MKEVTTKADTKMKMKNFVEIMSNVIKPANMSADNFTYSRLKRPYKGADLLGSNKRYRSMETSTPIQKFSAWREGATIPDTISPTSIDDGSGNSTNGSATGYEKTAISDELAVSRITPPKAESSSLEGRKLLTQTIDWDRAAVGSNVIKKTRSLSDLMINLSQNAFSRRTSDYKVVNLRRCNSVGAVREAESSIENYISQWSNNTVFGDEANTTPIETDDNMAKMLKLLNIKEKNEVLLNERATPGMNSIKRNLRMSPDTPVGMSMKVSVRESASPILQEINQGDLGGGVMVVDDMPASSNNLPSPIPRKRLVARRKITLQVNAKKSSPLKGQKEKKRTAGGRKEKKRKPLGKVAIKNQPKITDAMKITTGPLVRSKGDGSVGNNKE